MTRISVASLRISNPTFCVTIVCDSATDEALATKHDPLLSEIDDYLSIETPLGSAGFRNRHIKTRIRQLLDGPFLFLDSDTLVRGDLTDLYSLDVDLAGARNHSASKLEDQICIHDRETLDLMQWAIGQKVYINGGVLFYNDTPLARHFSEIWHKRWLQSWQKRQSHRDQPSLNLALLESQARLALLPNTFNAQIKKDVSVGKNCLIWHFYSSNKEIPKTAFDVTVHQLLAGDERGLKAVKAMVRRNHPWRRDIWLDDWVARSVMRKGRIDSEDQIWLEGKRILSMRYRFSQNRPEVLTKLISATKRWYYRLPFKSL
jgi:hypothetical protein